MACDIDNREGRFPFTNGTPAWGGCSTARRPVAPCSHSSRSGAAVSSNRAPDVAAELERYARRAPGGLPYVAPEVRLLYKAKPHPTGMEHNDTDFAAVVPDLDLEARRWLKAALERAHPDHHWLSDARLR